MNLLLTLNKALTLFGNNEALLDGGKRFTYQQFGGRVAQLARALSRRGVKKGSAVAVIAPNGHQYMEVYYACAQIGAVLVPVNYRLAAAEIAAILEDAEVSWLITHSDFFDLSLAVLEKSPAVKDTLWIQGKSVLPGKLPPGGSEYEAALSAESDVMPEAPALAADDLAHLYYTSGTTGKPKGVMLTHGNVTFHALASICELALTDADAWLHAAPMFHLADAWSTFAVTFVGGRHVFMPAFQAKDVLRTIARDRVSATILVPTMVNALLNEPSVVEHDYTTLRLIMTGGAPIAPEVVRKVVTTFGCDYSQLYGMTETSPILTLSFLKSHMRNWPEERQFEMKCRTGRAFIGAEVRVVRDDGSDVSADDRDVGEIIARGPGITPGYWKQPDATAQTIRNGWIHTGDLAVIDEEGFIKIVDRKKDMIITGGENVYSTEVEHALYEHQAVLECAVMGVPDPNWGEAVKAVVVLKAGEKASADELIAFVKTRLANYKAPRSIDFMDALPKTGSGKIYKKALREIYWSDRAVKVN